MGVPACGLPEEILDKSLFEISGGQKGAPQ